MGIDGEYEAVDRTGQRCEVYNVIKFNIEYKLKLGLFRLHKLAQLKRRDRAFLLMTSNDRLTCYRM